jgi:hypothetical protein
VLLLFGATAVGSGGSDIEEEAIVSYPVTIIWPVLIYAAGVATSYLLRYLVRYVRAYRKEAKRKQGEEPAEGMR